MNRPGTCAAAIVALCGCASSASAQIVAEWENAVSGNWSDDARWLGGVSPNNSGPDEYRAEITVSGAAFTISLDEDVLISELLLGSDDAVLQGVGAFGLDILEETTFTNIDMRGIAGGVNAFGTLTFDSSICDDLCDTPLSLMTGTGTWQGTGDIRLMGTSTFTIESGASFAIASNETMTLDAGATWANEGTLSKTTAGLTLIDGGTFDNTGDLVLSAGTFRLDNGALDVNGNGNVLDAGSWTVESTATLDAVGQSIITNNTFVRLEGGATFAALTGSLDTIGTNGELDLALGNTFTTAGNFTVASSGVLRVDGTSSFEVVGGSSLSNFSGGTLSGGIYEIGGTFSFDGAAIDTIDASLTLDGTSSSVQDEFGASALSGLDTIAGGGRFEVRAGRDFVTAGAFTNLGELVVGAPMGLNQSIVTVSGGYSEFGTTTLDGGTLITGMGYAQSGLLQGNGTVSGSVTAMGMISPGFSPGRIDIQGNLNVGTAAMILLEIEGAIPGVEHDVLAIDGLLNFANGQAGVLQIDFGSTFLPMPGEFFDVLFFQDVVGDFLEVNITPLGAGRDAILIRLEDRYRVEIVPAPATGIVLASLGLAAARRRRG